METKAVKNTFVKRAREKRRGKTVQRSGKPLEKHTSNSPLNSTSSAVAWDGLAVTAATAARTPGREANSLSFRVLVWVSAASCCYQRTLAAGGRILPRLPVDSPETGGREHVRTQRVWLKRARLSPGVAGFVLGSR